MLLRRGSTETQDIGSGDPEGHQTRAVDNDAGADRDLICRGLGIVALHTADTEGLLREPAVGADPDARTPGNWRAGDLVALCHLGYDEHAGVDRPRVLVSRLVGCHQVALSQLTLV